MLQLEDIIQGNVKVVKLQIRKTKSGNNYFTTIPLDIIDSLGWKEGDKLLVQKQDTKVTIEKIEPRKKE